jgi:hypothetical protein
LQLAKEIEMRKALCVFAGVLGGALVALGAFVVLMHFFQGVYPDCAPNQADGQCGLATFMDSLYAAGGALIVWPIVALLFSLCLLRWLVGKDALATKRDQP